MRLQAREKRQNVSAIVSAGGFRPYWRHDCRVRSVTHSEGPLVAAVENLTIVATPTATLAALVTDRDVVTHLTAQRVWLSP